MPGDNPKGGIKTAFGAEGTGADASGFRNLLLSKPAFCKAGNKWKEGQKLLIYLDNCCYNRPFDDQSQLKIRLETQAKLYIQKEIKDGIHEMVWSYVLDYENAKNPFEEKRETIAPWKQLAVWDVVETEEVITFAERLEAKGIKTFDALHIACAVTAGCDYFLTTDRKLLNTPIEGITIINPIQFVLEQEDTT